MADPPGGGFADDELEEFYRQIEIRTALTPQRRRGSTSRHRACPTPGKEAFRSEGAARGGIDRIRQSGRAAPNLRWYRCDCGSWHITSSPPRDEEQWRPGRRRRRR
ncbi:MAG: hypothetical protein QM662_03385 [Gordonia sp. (in: high G+C Gram-positive bacteria)]